MEQPFIILASFRSEGYNFSWQKDEFITPLKNHKAQRHKAGGFGTDFLGGFERKKQKKVHNGSENSENKKKYGVV